MTGLGRMADCLMPRLTLDRSNTIESRATIPLKGVVEGLSGGIRQALHKSFRAVHKHPKKRAHR